MISNMSMFFPISQTNGIPYGTKIFNLADNHNGHNNLCGRFSQSFYLSTDPDEMQHHAAFHLGLYCLP